jgi:DNA-binding MarR family transcriptional regulator
MTPAETRKSATQHIRTAVAELHRVGVPNERIINTLLGCARRYLQRDLKVPTRYQYRILQTLSRIEPATANDLAPAANICPTSARRNLVKLQKLGLVDAVTKRCKYSRGHYNERVWHVTESGLNAMRTEQ